MTRQACQYTIIRFMPHIETGEFANVGIVLWGPKTRNLRFKLLRCQYTRVTQFFDGMDANVYLRTMEGLDLELRRVRAMLESASYGIGEDESEHGFHRGLFQELIRPRETIVRFSEQRVILSESLEETLLELFKNYVDRKFVTKGQSVV